MTTNTDRPSSFLGINHIKLPCYNIHTTLQFYTNILPFVHVPEFNHYTPEHKLFAFMARHNDLIVEFRHDPGHAEKHKGWDPVTWGVQTRADLEEWAAWFDKHEVKRSKVFTGIKAWVLAAEDPDGKFVRVYCEETHEWTDHPDQDTYWLGTVKAQD